ncbi:MAG: hypothetical protein NC217_06335 [Muribaculaceae bacterium]|nr:hypothetical protein [Muribaculaceae bacterium]
MGTAKRIADGIALFTAGVTSWMKVPLMSSRAFKKGCRSEHDELVILGNGPSLRHTIDTEMPALMSRQRLAVNFAANSPEFRKLKPQLYVLADPHFFVGVDTDPNVARLWTNLADVDWEMSLYVPGKMVKLVRSRLNNDLTVKGFNLTPAEGMSALVYPLYNSGLAMPRPRNVLIPSIMIGIREGFKTIYIAGADHTWSKTLEVDEENRVVTVQPHFYKDNAEEKTRVTSTYANYHLHDILQSLYVAFRSYHQIQAWAQRKGVRIINITPGSFIDAFPRRKSIE